MSQGGGPPPGAMQPQQVGGAPKAAYGIFHDTQGLLSNTQGFFAGKIGGMGMWQDKGGLAASIEQALGIRAHKVQWVGFEGVQHAPIDTNTGAGSGGDSSSGGSSGGNTSSATYADIYGSAERIMVYGADILGFLSHSDNATPAASPSVGKGLGKGMFGLAG